MPSSRFPIPQGTLDMLILQILSLEAAHGYGIAQRLEQISRSVVHVPALYRIGVGAEISVRVVAELEGRDQSNLRARPPGRSASTTASEELTVTAGGVEPRPRNFSPAANTRTATTRAYTHGPSASWTLSVN